MKKFIIVNKDGHFLMMNHKQPKKKSQDNELSIRWVFQPEQDKAAFFFSEKLANFIATLQEATVQEV